MATFIINPKLIEAYQWFKNGDHPHDYLSNRTAIQDGESVWLSPEYCKEHGFEGELVRYYRDPDVPGETVCEDCGHTLHEHGFIEYSTVPNEDGSYSEPDGAVVCPGSWIIHDAAIADNPYPVFDGYLDLVARPVVGQEEGKALINQWNTATLPGINSHEALYGFMGWLTSRKQVVTFSTAHEASEAAELVEQWAENNNLPPVREGWHTLLKHPAE